MQISATGAGVGAVVGAVGRALVVIGWLGPAALIVALPSAGIGLLVGAIAGGLGKPLRGALVGFLLSAFVFELFMFACASALGDVAQLWGEKDKGRMFLTEVLPYTLFMGLAGAAAGFIGGIVGREGRKNDQPADGSASLDRPDTQAAKMTRLHARISALDQENPAASPGSRPRTEAFTCLDCGKPIPSDSTKCPACGWSYSG